MSSSINFDLIEAACDGDADAIEQLLCQHQPSITRFARKYCATAEDAEDAVQETLWTIYRKIGTLRSTAAFVSWTFQIVRHYCYDLLAPESEALSLIDDSMLDYIDLSGNPELSTALKNDVVNAIAYLPSAYRQILVMRDIEGYSAPEVAEILGITIETVKSRLHRARSLLRESLAGWVG